MSAGAKVPSDQDVTALHGGRRSTARLIAVQALYEMEMAGAPADTVLRQFMERRWKRRSEEESGASLAEPDTRWLAVLVQGVAERLAELDEVIGGALETARPLERLEVLLRAILRAGTYELMSRADVPARVVISEYMNIAHAFFAGKEPTLVNGVLDRLAHVLRRQELEDPSGGQAAEDR
jgi:N utilization substance protein B